MRYVIGSKGPHGQPCLKWAIAAAAAAALMPRAAQAAPAALWWSGNGTTIAGSGTYSGNTYYSGNWANWGVGTSTWNTADVGGGGSWTTWTDGSDAYFDAYVGSNNNTVYVPSAGITANSLNFTGNNPDQMYNVTQGGSGATVTLTGSAAITTNQIGWTASTISCPIGGSAGLNISGGGTLVLSGANVYSGNTVISSSLVKAQNAAAFGTSASVSVASGAGLMIGTSGLSFPTPLTISGNGLADAVHNKWVTGALCASGVTGVTWSGPITLANTSTIATGGSADTMTLTGGITSANMGLTFTGGGTLTVQNNPINIGNGQLTPMDSSTGVLQLNVAGNTWGGTNLRLGTLRVGVDNALPVATTVTMGMDSGTSTLDLNGHSVQIGGLTKSTYTAIVGNSSIANNAALNVNGTSSFGGVIQDAVGSGNKKTNLTVSGGSFTLTGVNLYSGVTNLTGGKLILGAGGSIANTPTITVGGSATFDVSAVSYVLGASQTLAGSGTVAGLLTASGTVSPGDAGIGTLSTGAVTFQSGSKLLADVGTAGSSDLLSSSGSVDLTASGNSLYLTGGTLSGTYTLVSAGAVNGTFKNVYWNGSLVANPTVGGIGGYELVYSPSALTLAAVPEPASVGLLGLTTCLALARRRRR